MRNLRAVYNQSLVSGVSLSAWKAVLSKKFITEWRPPNRALKKTDLIHMKNLLEETRETSSLRA